MNANPLPIRFYGPIRSLFTTTVYTGENDDDDTLRIIHLRGEKAPRTHDIDEEGVGRSMFLQSRRNIKCAAVVGEPLTSGIHDLVVRWRTEMKSYDDTAVLHFGLLPASIVQMSEEEIHEKWADLIEKAVGFTFFGWNSYATLRADLTVRQAIYMNKEGYGWKSRGNVEISHQVMKPNIESFVFAVFYTDTNQFPCEILELRSVNSDYNAIIAREEIRLKGPEADSYRIDHLPNTKLVWNTVFQDPTRKLRMPTHSEPIRHLSYVARFNVAMNAIIGDRLSQGTHEVIVQWHMATNEGAPQEVHFGLVPGYILGPIPGMPASPVREHPHTFRDQQTETMGLTLRGMNPQGKLQYNADTGTLVYFVKQGDNWEERKRQEVANRVDGWAFAVFVNMKELKNDHPPVIEIVVPDPPRPKRKREKAPFKVNGHYTEGDRKARLYMD